MILRSLTVTMVVLLGGLPAFAEIQFWPCTESPSGDVRRACFHDKSPKFVYGHSVLGNTREWSRVHVYDQSVDFSHGNKPPIEIVVPDKHVFEDVAPRLADINRDGHAELIVVESHKDFGARLSIYDIVAGTRVNTPHIGTRYRWLAPIGVADFNGDGDMDIAYVDRPHLAKTLRVWTYREDGLTEIATFKGVTNHSIGEGFITSSIRTCNGRPEMILNDANRKNIVSVFFENGKLRSKTLGKFTGRNSVETPPAC